MQKLLMTSAAAVMLGAFMVANAHAADLFVPPPPPPAVWSWEGPYIGAYGGWAHSRTKATDLDGTEFGDQDVASVPGVSLSMSDDDFFAGGTIGYNFQSGAFVFGPEVELGYINNDRLYITEVGDGVPDGDGADDDGILTEYGFYGVAAGRVGYAVDRVLVFAKGGLAFADIKNAGGEYDGKGDEDSDGKWGFDGDESGFGSDIRLGFAIGGGVEWAVADQWSVKAEYLYMDFGSKTYNGTDNDSRYKFKNTLHTVKVGVNWLF